MNLIHSLREDSFLGTQIIFEIPLPSHPCVYMRLDNKGALENERCIVIVDSLKFIGLWKSEPYNFNSELSYGNPNVWRSDRKYIQAEKGFSKGIENPVPLANVVCNSHTAHDPIYEKKYHIFNKLKGYKERVYDFIDFNNGITRTIWLLAHNASCFPVECHNANGAERLFKNCGVSGSKISTVFQIINT